LLVWRRDRRVRRDVAKYVRTSDYTGLDQAAAAKTLGAVLKYHEDEELVRARGLSWLVGDEASR